MDRKAKKHALQMLSNGMYVMTSGGSARDCGATVTWVSQASFQPPLIMAAVRKDSRIFKCVSESQVAVIHVLAHAQLDVARKFMCHASAHDGTLNGECFTTGITSAPVLQNVPALVECKVRRIVDDVGDHAVMIMEVVDAQCREQARPLTVADSPWEYGG